MSDQPDFNRILMALQNGELILQGQFISGSNSTFLGQVQHEELTLPVVYKPVRGETPLWDFPVGSLARREVAAFILSQALGWELVPPTVLRKRGPLGKGSVQWFVDHDPERHYFNFTAADKERLRSTVLFDLLINNADRKGGHILLDETSHLWLIDHGVCFHVEDKLRTVVWDFAGRTIPAELLADVARVVDTLQDQASALTNDLTPLLRVSELRALARRGRKLIEQAVFPPPPANRRSFPWPPV